MGICSCLRYQLVYTCVLTWCMFLCKVMNGATFVNIDMIENKKDGTRMLLVEGLKLSHLARLN